MRFFTALLAATLPLATTGLVQLLPHGEFAARDGRPGPGKTWKVDDAAGTRLAAQLNAVTAATPVVIDYEHQTLHAPTNGKPAPAAAWIQRVEWRTGQGLFAEVQWTPAALTAVKAGEYRYISPVIVYDAAGNVQSVAMAALTNYPALLGMDAVVAALNTLTPTPPTPQQTQESHMDLLTALLAAIGLATGTNEATALTAVSTMKAELDALRGKPPVPTALRTALGLAAGADEAAALTAVANLRGGDAGTLQIVQQLQQQVAALTGQLNEGKLVELVDGAIAANKFAPAHRDWLLSQGRANFAALSGVIAAAPAIPGLGGQTQGRDLTQQQQQAALTGDAAKLMTAFGLTPEQFAKGAPAAA